MTGQGVADSALQQEKVTEQFPESVIFSGEDVLIERGGGSEIVQVSDRPAFNSMGVAGGGGGAHTHPNLHR